MVAAVIDPDSVGVRTYTERLAEALAQLGVNYRPSERPVDGARCHIHLANSTRSVIPHAARQRRPFLLTVHDVVPRTPALRPLHRAVVVPLCTRRASRVIVHSKHAARLLARTSTVAWDSVEVVPHPAPAPHSTDRAAARLGLGLESDGPPLFVLPGVLKAAKLVVETLTAAAPLLAVDRARLLLAGRVRDEGLAATATAVGAQLIRDPDPATYERAIVAADAVLCLRADSVGESNGPLLDAIGAGRPSLVTGVGSAPEVAGESARVIGNSAAEIRAGLEAMLDPGERDARAGAASARASELTWEMSARRHLELLSELDAA